VRARVIRSFKWHGEAPYGVEIAEGTVVSGACAVNAVAMGAAEEIVDDVHIAVGPDVVDEATRDVTAEKPKRGPGRPRKVKPGEGESV
jgi:hypothetical protein